MAGAYSQDLRERVIDDQRAKLEPHREFLDAPRTEKPAQSMTGQFMVFNLRL
jgi:hypothetical protein